MISNQVFFVSPFSIGQINKYYKNLLIKINIALPLPNYTKISVFTNNTSKFKKKIKGRSKILLNKDR